MISLGCAKNQVDSELILARFIQDGWMLAENPLDADICLVNTCAFLASARDECEEVFRDILDNRRDGFPKLVATGCLPGLNQSQNSPYSELLSLVDAAFSFDQYDHLPKQCRTLLGNADSEKALTTDFFSFMQGPRLRFGYPHLAYLKISEGCSNCCHYCLIPAIRGPLRSRNASDILTEARQLLEDGAREIMIIGQDTAAYGMDQTGTSQLPELLKSLSGIEADCWFRLMYAHPKHLTDEILDCLAADERFCRYLDLPLQHISSSVLHAMNRGMNEAETRTVLRRIQEQLPGTTVRTTFITGHPDETEQDVEQLAAFIREQHFLHVGIFAYSPEPGTVAAGMPNQIPEAERERRRDYLFRVQAEVSRTLYQHMLNQKRDVMIDLIRDDGTAQGHLRSQAPDVDGGVFLEKLPQQPVESGDTLACRITQADTYDIQAEPI